MRYRTLDQDGDMTFGQGALNFLVDSPTAVAQAIVTRLRLEVGEWFLDVTAGTDYQTQVLGFGTEKSRDIEIRNRIIETPGVLSIDRYVSTVSPNRVFRVEATVSTIYGQLTVFIGSDIIAPTGYGILDWSIDGNILIMVV